MPASNETVALFLTNMAVSKRTLTLILGFRAAICFYHTIHHSDEPIPTDSGRVSLVINGIKKKFCHPVAKKKQLSQDMVRLLLLKLRCGRLETLSLLKLH